MNRQPRTREERVFFKKIYFYRSFKENRKDNNKPKLYKDYNVLNKNDYNLKLHRKVLEPKTSFINLIKIHHFSYQVYDILLKTNLRELKIPKRLCCRG